MLRKSFEAEQAAARAAFLRPKPSG
jgi:hypothetical protein